MGFLNEYFFLLSGIAVAVFFLLMFFLNKRLFFTENRKKISYIIGASQFINMFVSIVCNIYLKRYASPYIRFTELCPLLTLISAPIFFINKDSLYKSIMPGLFIASSLTMLGTIPNRWIKPETSIPDIFTKVTGDLAHVLMLVSGFFIWSLDLKYSKKDYKALMILPIFLTVGSVFFAVIPFYATGGKIIGAGTSALIEYDTKNGDYAFFDDIAPYPIATIIFYVLAVSVNYFIAAWNTNKILVNNGFKKQRKNIFKKIKK